MSASYTSELAETLAPDLLRRFERYVRIDTQSTTDREQSPSTPGQLDLGRVLVEELTAAGLDDAMLDENGYVTATLTGTSGNGPVVGLIAHMDTCRGHRRGADRAPRLRRRGHRTAPRRHAA
jgi:tripeptide aminopeptidase